jgi:hypothetical protein
MAGFEVIIYGRFWVIAEVGIGNVLWFRFAVGCAPSRDGLV